MRKIILITIIAIIALKSSGQLSHNKYGVECFLNGSKLFEAGNYKGADSLYTLALCTYKDKNVYFNRGMSRLLQYDTIGFCNDFNLIANKYFDNQAAQIFTNICCNSVDTFYYDKKLLPASKEKFKYLEEIRHLKYDTISIGIFHNIRLKKEVVSFDYGCQQNIIGVNLKTTDIIAIYEIRDTIKYYHHSTKRATIHNQLKYEQLKDKAIRLLQIRYSDLKKENNIDELSIIFSITISRTGIIEDVKYVGLFPEIPIGEKANDLEKELIDIVNHYPKFIPASFKKENVSFIFHDIITY